MQPPKNRYDASGIQSSGGAAAAAAPYSNSGGIRSGPSLQLPGMTNPIGLSDITSRFANVSAKVKGALSFGGSISPAGLFFLLVIVAILCYLFVTQYTLQQTETGSVNTIETARQLQSIKEANREQPLRNFYIKTALNCCCLGEWKNNYVDLTALEYAIKQGYRCLDFEIYSLNDVPIVSASTKMQDFHHTETFNHLTFSEVCTRINELAFTQAPNKDDPLFINLRIKSKNKEANFVKRIIDCIKMFGSRLLGPEYNYEFGGQNLGKVPIKNFMGKVIIMVDISNSIVKNNCPSTSKDPDSCLHQYVNIGNGSPFLHDLKYEMNVKNAPNMNELIEHNKKNMSIVFPDPPYTVNLNFNVAKAFGCQFIGMMPLLKDANLKLYNTVFNKDGSAFALKPSELCYKPVVIETPKSQNPALSFATRQFITPYAEFKV
jgi:hypothetical protein